MKSIIYLSCFVVLLYLQSCGGGLIKHKDDGSDQTPTGSHSKAATPVATSNLVVNNEKDLIGYWVGEFGHDDPESDDFEPNGGANKINIAIDEINNNEVKGHTVIAGKVRVFTGKKNEADGKYLFKFNGGAEKKENGTFKFSISKGDSIITGRWEAGKNNVANYKLTKHLFNYNASWTLRVTQYVDEAKSKRVTVKTEDGGSYQNDKYFSTSDEVDKYNASADLLTKDYVANLKKADFLVLRNSIFARHGYTFKKPLLSSFFSMQPWYVPLSNDVTAQLTDIEKKNIALMKPYEKNAEEYYGVFGR